MGVKLHQFIHEVSKKFWKLRDIIIWFRDRRFSGARRRKRLKDMGDK